ncbi:MAG: hypothetical protein JJT75_09770 [Opitutales bacterium]|nr:hypothetical protein [Opitutales bacterium]MCH8539963.1 hypothetical protein [Opitutales bacterium]
MKKQRKNQFSLRFLNTLIFGILILLISLGAMGLWTVNIRQNIAESAGNIRALENQLAQLDRAIGRVDSELANAKTPQALLQKMELAGLELQPPADNQIIRLNTERRLAVANGQRLFAREIGASEEIALAERGVGTDP